MLLVLTAALAVWFWSLVESQAALPALIVGALCWWSLAEAVPQWMPQWGPRLG